MIDNVKNSKIYIIVLLAIFIITFGLQMVVSFYSIEKDFKQRVSFLHKKGVPRLNNQINITQHRLTIIKSYSNILSNITNELKQYDENVVSDILKKHFLPDMCIFQLRLLSSEGMELIRYELDKAKNVKKITSLQDKSNRYYYKEAKDININDIYFSEFDLNIEHGKIEIPYKHTIRAIKKVEMSNEIFYILINYNITDIFEYTFMDTLYDIFLIEDDNQINFHLNNNYSFSKQLKKGIYLKDIMTEENQYITQKDLTGFQYKVVVSVKKSQLNSLLQIKKESQKESTIISGTISLLITLILFIIYKRKLNNELRNQYKLTQSILNAQDNFTLLRDKKNIILTNQTTLDFLGYKTLEEFRNEHNCIGDFFLEEDGYLSKEQNGKTWIEVILEDLSSVHKVKILDKHNRKNIFYINITDIKFENEDFHAIIFTNITEFELLYEQKIQQELGLQEQSKMASMGEMIGNIAHQWRQPLSVIGSLTNNLQLKKILGTLTDDKLDDSLKGIEDSVQYLSQTIDTFRDFIKEKKELKEVILQERIDIVLNIINATLKSSYIELKNNIDYSNPIKITFVVGELSQVLINILNNAKDILVERDIENAWIKLDLQIQEDKVVITVEDNGGGMPDDVLPKIFDPYFTTKHESQGTGLGLHMSYKMVVDGLKGKLYAKNTTNGAKFFIELPILNQ